MSKYLEKLARRVQDDASFLAAALARYAASEQLDDAALAAKLGCDVPALTHLRLCGMPRPQAPFFWQDVEAIATRFGADPDALAEAVRRGQALLNVGRKAGAPANGSAGFFMAARDDDREPPEPPPEGGAP
jgi:hypothetical protein